MPTYSYKCPTCGNAFDIVQSFTDDDLSVCGICGNSLRKVFSPIGVSFSGAGFYRNDSRPTPKAEGASVSSGSGDSGSTSSSSSDSGSSTPGGTSAGTATPAVKPAAKPATTGASTS